MTIAAQTNRTSITGNGLTTSIPCTFPFTAQTDLVVVETIIATGVQTVKTLTTDYTVTGTVDALGQYPNGGTVVMTVAPASTVTITVYRDVPTTQSVDPVQNDKLPVDSAIEAPLDKLTMIAIRLKERVDRSLHQPDGDSANMTTLPAKTTRASRYMGFDGDGNPTMMQTPTGMVTSIAQLTESTVAGLPAAGSAGELRKVTDSIRGIWMDSGVQWIQIGGGVADIRWFGAKGDGVTDDTAAIQAALDTGASVFIPYGSFITTAVLLLRVNRQRLYGTGKGSIIKCTASSGIFCAIAVVENTADVEIDNFTLLGNASSEPAGPAPVRGIVTGTNSTGTAHSAVSWDARCRIQNMHISGVTPGTTGFNLGMQVNKSNKSLVRDCVIDSIYGTNGSFGYGIVVHGEDIDVVNTNVYATISGQGRHAFYLTSTPERVHVINCHAEGFRSEPFTTNIGSGGTGLAFINCTAKDCMTASTGTHDAVFAFHGGSKGRIIGCRAYGAGASSDNFGVTVKDHDHALVSDVYMENVSLHAVYIENADYTRIANIHMNLVGTFDVSQYGGVTVIGSDYVNVDSVTMVGPARFVARLDSSVPQPVGCRFSNLLYSGSFTFIVENDNIDPGTNHVTAYALPSIPRADLAAAGAALDGRVVIDDNGSGDRNLVVYEGGQRFRIDGGSNV